MSTSQFLNSLTSEALPLAVVSVGLGVHSSYLQKSWQFMEEWFYSILFHHISQECRVGLRQIYDIFSEKFAFSSAIHVILTQVNLPLKVCAGQRAEAQGSPSLATGRSPVGQTQGQGSSSCTQGRTAPCETGSLGSCCGASWGPWACRPDVKEQTAGIKRAPAL